MTEQIKKLLVNTPQEFTELEKAQGRANLGINGTGDLSDHAVLYDPQSLTSGQKDQARINIDATKVMRTTTSLPPSDTNVDTLQIFADGRVRGDNTDLGCIAPNVSQEDAGKILVASWHGSPGVGTAQWQTMPDVTPWGVNTNTSVTFIDHPETDDPNIDKPWSIQVDGIQNFKNNIVNITIPVDSTVPWCEDDFWVIRINPPAVSSQADGYGYNFWVRIAINKGYSAGYNVSTFEVDIPTVGCEMDQYRLEETDTPHTFSTKRMKIEDTDQGYTTVAQYKIGEQQVGPGATPTTSMMNHYSTVEPVVMDYWEEFTANTGEAHYTDTLHAMSYQLKNEYDTLVPYKSISAPNYGYTNYYMIKVSGDMFKLSRFQPHA